MRIGLIIGLHGRPEGEPPPPRWSFIREQASTAERIGFDLVVFEDALLYEWGEAVHGLWESMTVAGALAAATSRIEFGQSVINAPYRSPAMIAKMADTLDEISGGRYILGIGAGNTDDYANFGFHEDLRYSRFAEGIEIIHSLLKTGSVDFAGSYQSAKGARMVFRGPRPQGPPIVLAAGSPKMLRLAARYADGWNWWTTRPVDGSEDLALVIHELERACEEEGRDPSTLTRSVDLYSIDPLGGGSGTYLGGGSTRIAEKILTYAELGFEEARCDLTPLATPAAIEAMAEVVQMVHSG